ncbi:MAG TPA: DUF1501 domain-containing protein [Steroidobacteraceae bacterium]|nr:DUF1501 domain-containing protein [Steroidobacteraceae bacterium]
MDRRHFLKHASALGGSVALAQLGVLAARAQTVATDYKALVCLFLYGGNDANNTIVPIDSAGYASYAAVRGRLALAQGTLLPLVEASGTAGFGLHPALGGTAGLQGLWESAQLAIVRNVGTLVQPLTKTQYLSPSTAKPASLFSHIDQQHQWQASLSVSPSDTGWGGRLADQLAILNSGGSIPSMVSTAGNNLFVTGRATQALTIPTSGSFALQGFDNSAGGIARLAALKSLLGVDRGTDLLDAAQDVMTGALASSAVLNPILTNTTSPVSSYFTGLTSSFAKQMLAVAKVIEARASLGVQRQVFLVSLGSFDTHTDELNTHDTLFGDLGAGLKAFHDAMTGIGAAQQVTSFTLSDFSRTYLPNTNGGSDHGWGSHHFVAGGAVKGRAYYGTWPTLTVGGPDDEGSEGRWIPTTAVDQYAATLASWFGADASALASVLPNLASFSPATLGFV